jgi:hypothetical protein
LGLVEGKAAVAEAEQEGGGVHCMPRRGWHQSQVGAAWVTENENGAGHGTYYVLRGGGIRGQKTSRELISNKYI